MDELHFINDSNDKNNSQIVIFEGSEQLAIAPAWQIISLNPGETKHIQVNSDKQFYISIIVPEIAVTNGIMNIKEITTPAVTMGAGQTAYITGNAALGYKIALKD